MDKEVSQATVHEVTKESDTTQRPNNNEIYIYIYIYIYTYMYVYIYMYIYPLFLGFTSYLHHHRALSRVRCAIK